MLKCGNGWCHYIYISNFLSTYSNDAIQWTADKQLMDSLVAAKLLPLTQHTTSLSTVDTFKHWNIPIQQLRSCSLDSLFQCSYDGRLQIPQGPRKETRAWISAPWSLLTDCAHYLSGHGQTFKWSSQQAYTLLKRCDIWRCIQINYTFRLDWYFRQNGVNVHKASCC